MSNEAEQLKSALDIALEKASKLGKMSDEERLKAKENEFAAVAEALAARYLKGLPERDIELEMAKYKADRQTVIRHLVVNLWNRIEPGNSSEMERIASAIEHFTGNSKVAQQLRKLATEYDNEIQRNVAANRDKIENAIKKDLKQKGIAGSAVVPVTESGQAWIRLLEDVKSRYRKRLEEMESFLKAL